MTSEQGSRARLTGEVLTCFGATWQGECLKQCGGADVVGGCGLNVQQGEDCRQKDEAVDEIGSKETRQDSKGEMMA